MEQNKARFSFKISLSTDTVNCDGTKLLNCFTFGKPQFIKKIANNLFLYYMVDITLSLLVIYYFFFFHCMSAEVPRKTQVCHTTLLSDLQVKQFTQAKMWSNWNIPYPNTQGLKLHILAWQDSTGIFSQGKKEEEKHFEVTRKDRSDLEKKHP